MRAAGPDHLPDLHLLRLRVLPGEISPLRLGALAGEGRRELLT
jgi:hypothetical protein